MSHVATYNELPKVVNLFMQALKDVHTKSGKKSEEWYVIFNCGTIVAVNEADKPFDGYTDQNYEFPEHRVSAETMAEIKIKNKEIWELQKKLEKVTKVTDKEGVEQKLEESKLVESRKIISSAFQLLISDGYPYPGGQEADRTAMPFNEEFTLWCIQWPYRSDAILNFIVLDDEARKNPMYASVIGADLRRYDYMGPEVRYLVDKDLTLYQV